MSKAVSIFLTDDHRMMNEGLRQIIESRPQYQVQKVFSNAEDTLEALHFGQPDVLITDINMPGMGGLELAAKVKQQYPHVRVLILSMHQESSYIKKAIQMAKVNGYLLKDSRADEVFDAIDALMQGSKYISPKAASALLETRDEEEPELSPREVDVLREVAKGKTTRDIADTLHLSTHTIDTYRKNLLVKSNCSNTAELIVWGVGKGYIGN